MANGAEGTLASRPLVHLLIYALDNELTGSFELTAPDGSEAAAILMARGCPAKVRVPGVDSFLGDMLVELGYLAPEAVAPTFEQAAAQGVPHGQVLLAEGLITQDQLVRGVREQTLRKVAILFTLPLETRFVFHDGIDLLPEFGAADLVLTDPFPAIWASIKSRPPEEHVRNLLARALSSSFRLVRGERTDRFRFGREERGLVEAMKVSDMGIADLVGLRVLPERAVQLFVYCLLVTKQIEMAPARGAQAAPPTSASMGPPPSSRRPDAGGHGQGPSSVRAPAAGTSPGTTPPPRASAAPAAAAPAPAARPTAAPRSAELSSREKAIVERARTIKNEDYFQRLSVARDASPSQVDEAYAAVSRLWDASAYSAAVREPGKVVQAAIAEAHEHLRDPAKRDIYMKKLLLGLAHAIDPAEDLAASGASNELDGAKACLDKGDLERAERLAKRASKAKPDSAYAMALHAWIDAQLPINQSTDQTRQRILKLDRAVRLDGECQDAVYWRAMLQMRIGNYHAALRDWVVLAEDNPDNRDYQRERRECEELAKGQPLRSRKESSGSSGFFGRLLKK